MNTFHTTRRRLPALLLSWAAALCWITASPVLAAPGDKPLVDPVQYSSAPNASLPSAVEAAAISHGSVKLSTRQVPYTATTGHLTAFDADSGKAKASMFYVAYTVDRGKPADRPVTFFYNGGPGSATIWLHLGSFGPKRMDTGVPDVVKPGKMNLVDSRESLLDVTDLVFVDAVGTGYSQAIAPYTNRKLWGVDVDAEVFRDFITRYIDVNKRSASPKYLYGESYGGIRTGVLAKLMEQAGVSLAGVIMNSPILNFNANCDAAFRAVSCEGFVPSYSATGAFFDKVTPPPTDVNAFLEEMRTFTAETYAPANDAWLKDKTPPPPSLPPQLEANTGLDASYWEDDLNVTPGTYRTELLPAMLLGRYDARMALPKNSPPVRNGEDPSLVFIETAFVAALDRYLPETLLYTNASPYAVFASVIWDFRHDGKLLPDVVPDLAAAVKLNPAMKVLTVHGWQDFATPFFQTEQDLMRIEVPILRQRSYDGGHMTYLDDASRPQMKADLRAYYRGVLPPERPVQPTLLRHAKPLTPQEQAWLEAPLPPVRAGAIETTRRDPWVPDELKRQDEERPGNR
jgi:carboxypeptidase C (cathepsin A)